MNSVSNSDSEQCTESRLGRVHNVHTPMAQPARTLARVAGLVQSCRRRPLPCRYTHACAGTPCRRPCATCRVAGRVLRAMSRIVSSRRALYRGATCVVSQPVSLPLLQHKCRPKPRYNSCIGTLTPSGKTLARARAQLALRAGRSYRRPPGRVVAMLWPSRGALLTISWP